MTTQLPLPTYESVLIEAMRSLAIDSGVSSGTSPVLGNSLTDQSKRWATNVHRNRLVKIIKGAGAGQLGVVNSNSDQTLIIREAWAMALNTTSVYVILDFDMTTEFTELKAALLATVEASIDTGIATGGSNTTIVDTGKSWAVNMWAGATFEVVIGGIQYLGIIASNTANTVTIPALAGGAVVVAGSTYSLRRPVTLADISDRAARLLGVVYGSQAQQLQQRAATFDLLVQLRSAGVEIDPRVIRALTAADIVTVQSITEWGGTALTGRDISGDFANLDIALSLLARMAQFVPLEKAAQHEVAETAGVDILAADLTPTNTPCLFRIMVVLSVAGIFSARLTNGGTTVVANLNSGVALPADCAYMFDVLVHSGDTVNFQTTVNGNVTLRVQEIVGGVQ